MFGKTFTVVCFKNDYSFDCVWVCDNSIDVSLSVAIRTACNSSAQIPNVTFGVVFDYDIENDNIEFVNAIVAFENGTITYYGSTMRNDLFDFSHMQEVNRVDSIGVNWFSLDNMHRWIVRIYNAYGFGQDSRTYYDFLSAYAAYSSCKYVNASVDLEALDVTLPLLAFASGLGSQLLDFGVVDNHTYDLVWDANESLWHVGYRNGINESVTEHLTELENAFRDVQENGTAIELLYNVRFESYWLRGYDTSFIQDYHGVNRVIFAVSEDSAISTAKTVLELFYDETDQMEVQVYRKGLSRGEWCMIGAVFYDDSDIVFEECYC